MIKTKLTLIVLSSIMLISTATYSQVRCTQDEAFERLKERDPVMYKSIKDQLEKQKEESSAISKSGIQKAATTKYIIPIVFHVLHTGGPEMISEAQIIDAVRILNEDFNALSPDTGDIDSLFWSIYADIGIEFRLAQIDPNGNCSNGINYYFDPKNTHGETCEWGEIQAQWEPNQWDYDKYLNIYTLTDGGSWSYGPRADNTLSGVGVNHGGVGSIGTGPPYGDGWTRTLTHEIGHWLSLPHTWGENDPDHPDGCDTDDGIDDTPNTDGTWGCNLNENSCDVGEPGDLKDNTQNYMDYGCSIMFTEGQKTVMINTMLDTVMDNLFTQTNLENTGTADPYVYGSTPCTPRVEINMDTEDVLCEGASAVYSYYHHHAVLDSILWKFPGGNPDTSTSETPVVSYATGGKYDAILTGYSNGLSDTDTLVGAVKINTLDGGISLPFVETFEDNLGVDSLWSIINPDKDKFKWKNQIAAAYSGYRSLKMFNNSNAPIGNIDEIVSPVIDLSSAPDSTVITFMLAAAQKGNATEKLFVFFSKDCGETWKSFYYKNGTDLSTTTTSTNNFIPTINEWRQERIVLPIEYNVSGVLFKFKFKGDNGSNLYIDDINCSVVGINDKSIDRSLRIFPNPIGSNSVITFDLLNQEEVVVEIVDILGREISNRNHGKLSKGSHRLDLGDAMFDQKGIHIVKIKFNKEVVTRKVVVE